MRIEQQLLDELIKIEFGSLLNRDLKIKWTIKSKGDAKKDCGWPCKFVAFVCLKEDYVFLNRRLKRLLRKNTLMLREILRHELLHLEIGLREPRFHDKAMERHVIIGLNFIKGEWFSKFLLSATAWDFKTCGIKRLQFRWR